MQLRSKKNYNMMANEPIAESANKTKKRKKAEKTDVKQSDQSISKVDILLHHFLKIIKVQELKKNENSAENKSINEQNLHQIQIVGKKETIEEEKKQSFESNSQKSIYLFNPFYYFINIFLKRCIFFASY